ncbi:type II toxin-antitoxin system RelE family toxin [Thermodesulfatator autotrophicus]|uniref:Plasmid stabilization protein n=1 Tax=Thermodesulfatator autotrophicus TaxID=1795632 RepID=A0A177E7H1_9BACT|nr:type II toxin-antitoxin system RelE/ParE family toxin [Thermodesulfatator autotrophicus]OAG26969.1 hypothetical protein TH606_09490 [Thermodesulfatator autotrophicus]
MKRKVVFKKGAYKDLAKIPKEYQNKIIEALRNLEENFQGDIRKLAPKRYRLRVGVYRVLIKEEGEFWVVYKIVHRQSADKYY